MCLFLGHKDKAWYECLCCGYKDSAGMNVSVPGYKDVLLCLRSLIATDCTAIVLGSSDSCGERGGGDPAGQLGSGSAHPGLRRAGDGAA